MRPHIQNPQINISKISGGSGIAGGIAAGLLMLIMVIDIPKLWYITPAAIVVGCAVALVLHFIRYKNPGAAWILPATKK